MSEKESEKSPERAWGSSIDEARRKIRESQGKIDKVREEQMATRKALAKEIIDTMEGNKRLNATSQNLEGDLNKGYKDKWTTHNQQHELHQGYRRAEAQKQEEISTLASEVARGKEDLALLSQEIERIKGELKRDPSLNIELPLGGELQEISQAIAESEGTLKTLQQGYRELTERNRKFQEDQEKFAYDPLKSASDTVLWAYEEMPRKRILSLEERKALIQERETLLERELTPEERMLLIEESEEPTRKRLSEEERKALIEEREKSLGRKLTPEERILLIEESEGPTKKSLSQDERNAINQEVREEMQRRSQIEQQKYEAQRQRQEKERKEKELAGYQERLDKVNALFREHENSINEAVRVMEEELEDELFRNGVEEKWSMIVKNHDLLKGGRFSRLLSLTNKKTVQENFTSALDAFSAEHSKKYSAAAEIAQKPSGFVDKQTSHWEQGSNLYNTIHSEKMYFEAYDRSYFQAANPELDKRFKEFFKAQQKLVQEMNDFSVAIRQKISAYVNKLAEVFHKQEVDKMDSFARRLPRI